MSRALSRAGRGGRRRDRAPKGPEESYLDHEGDCLSDGCKATLHRSRRPCEAVPVSTVKLTPAQLQLLLRLARRPDACRGRRAIPAAWLVEKGLARVDNNGIGPYFEITAAGRRYIATGS
jgi:hypothetical protein